MVGKVEREASVWTGFLRSQNEDDYHDDDDDGEYDEDEMTVFVLLLKLLLLALLIFAYLKELFPRYVVLLCSVANGHTKKRLTEKKKIMCAWSN